MLKKIEKWLEKFLIRSDTEDKEFLPPAVEVLETPPSPMGRMLVWAVLILFVLVILWSFIGEIDEVVVARGKVIPIGYTKVLQSEDKGIVKRILVQEGQKVKEGELPDGAGSNHVRKRPECAKKGNCLLRYQHTPYSGGTGE